MDCQTPGFWNKTLALLPPEAAAKLVEIMTTWQPGPEPGVSCRTAGLCSSRAVEPTQAALTQAALLLLAMLAGVCGGAAGRSGAPRVRRVVSR